MLGQPLSAWAMYRVPLGKWVAGNVFCWGICILLDITSNSFGTFATSRFFLGFFEASMNPVFVLIVAQY